MTQFSDAKYMAQAIQAKTPEAPARVNPAHLVGLRGTLDKRQREATMLVPDVDGAYEPVSFQHPENGRRVYGWFVAVDGDGNARVEIGDGEYAVVPPNELKRLGAKDDRSAIQAQLRAAIGQVSLDQDGVRSDIAQTQQLVPLGADDDYHMLSLSYAASLGVPSPDELLAYVDRFHPGKEITEIDSQMPGRVGVLLRACGEMDAVHGGEVIETLDPEDVVEKEAQLSGLKKMVAPLALGMGLGMTSPGVATSAPNPQAPQVQQGKPYDPANQGKYQPGTLKDPKDNANKYPQGKTPDPIFQNEAAALKKEIEEAKARYKSDPMLPFFMQGVRAVTQSPGDPKAVQAAHDALMKDVASKNMNPMQPLKAFNEGVGIGQKFTRMTQIQEERLPKGGSLDKEAIWPFRKKYNVTPAEAAKHLFEKKSPLAAKALEVYFRNGGAKTIMDTPGSFNTERLLQAALPVVQRVDPRLWQQVSEQASAANVRGPNDPKLQQQPGAQKPLSTNPSKLNQDQMDQVVQDSVSGTDTDLEQEQIDDAIQRAVSGPPGGVSSPGAVHVAPPKAASRRVADLRKKADLAAEGLPASAYDAQKKMALHRIARRGDYIVGRVKFDPKSFQEGNTHAMRNGIVSFVKAQVASGEGRTSYGFIGRVHVLQLDPKKGDALVKFSALNSGSAPLETVDAIK